MSWITNLSLKSKMLFGIILFIFINIVISFLALQGLNKVSLTYSHVANINLPNSDTLNGMLQNELELKILNLRYFALPITATTETEDLYKQISSKIVEYEKADALFETIPFVEGEEPIYKEVAESWKALKAENEQKIIEKKSGRIIADLKLDKLDSLSSNFHTKLEKLINFQSQQAKIWKEQAEAVSKSTFNTQVILTSLAGLLSLLFGYLFSEAISKSLNSFVVSISKTSKQVENVATEIASESQQLSQATTEQAAAVQETSSAIEETSAMVNKNSDNSKAAATNSTECQIKAEKGKDVVEKMIQSMDEINTSNNNIMTQINHSNDQFIEIVKIIQEIGIKTQVINDIVFQTKLLSFNASVEAARAGENGKGFAVVAEEVGNLAQMSGNAAKEITALLDGSIEKVESIVTETKSKVEKLVAVGKDKVDSGIDIAKQCSEVLTEIVNEIATVSSMAGEISAASQDQSLGIQEISKAINQIDQVTQINATSSEKMANASVGLTTQTVSLNSAIQDLVQTIQGRSGTIQKATSKKPIETNAKANSKKSSKPDSTSVGPKYSQPKQATPKNVIPLKKKQMASEETVEQVERIHVDTTPYKSPGGDGAAPSNTHPGFKDV
ncbi:MAG: methyl-accepting chemotaxis protein [Pseudobdellovibrio sp.]